MYVHSPLHRACTGHGTVPRLPSSPSSLYLLSNYTRDSSAPARTFSCGGKNSLTSLWHAEHHPLPPPAIRLVPSTPPRSRRTAAEGASRATKRDALADSPSRAPAHPKKTRAVGSVQAALAAAAPPQPPNREPIITATNYAAAALAAAANPHPPSA